MTPTALQNWEVFNQTHLTAALAEVKASLRARVESAGQAAAGENGAPPPSENAPLREASLPPKAERDRLVEGDESAAEGRPAALQTLCATFGLSPFERSLLLLCAGLELDSAFAPLCAAAQGDPLRNYPTFSLALAALPEAHWSALTPAAPLRRWRLIEVSSGNTLTLSPLRIDERMLHFLAGVSHLDERLVGLVEPVQPAGEMVESHRAIARQLAAAWSRQQPGQPLPIAQLCGPEAAGKRTIAAAACAALGVNLAAISAHALPQCPAEIEALARLWEREAVLGANALLVDCDEFDAGDSARAAALARFVERIGTALIVTSRERRRIPRRQSLSLEVRQPTVTEQRQLWQSALGGAAEGLNGQVDALVSQFSLSAGGIRSACAGALSRHDPASPPIDGQGLWEACRAEARHSLEELAQRIEPAATWYDLVLPEPQQQILRDLATHVRHRSTVYETWGFAGKGARGMGISALFAGASGTGKTMAAEVLARELRLDLYRIDLSATVSKYIGETGKNLRRVFDAAENGGAILLFDEADALFGKRSEVKDSHDRFANIEVSYLLQRMEAYRGLAILTTNMKSALDTAFLRRIRFVVQFPFPDAAQRAEIWRRTFPAGTPTEGLDLAKLSRLNVPGGNIRNVAINAAFLAADAREPVRMSHLLRAAHTEYAKLEKPLTDAEIGNW